MNFANTIQYAVLLSSQIFSSDERRAVNAFASIAPAVTDISAIRAVTMFSGMCGTAISFDDRSRINARRIILIPSRNRRTDNIGGALLAFWSFRHWLYLDFEDQIAPHRPRRRLGPAGSTRRTRSGGRS